MAVISEFLNVPLGQRTPKQPTMTVRMRTVWELLKRPAG